MNGSVRTPLHRARCFAPNDPMQSGRTATRTPFVAAVRVRMPFVSAITLLLVITAPARATTTVEFEGIGSFTTTVLAHQGVTVTGSNNISSSADRWGTSGQGRGDWISETAPPRSKASAGARPESVSGLATRVENPCWVAQFRSLLGDQLSAETSWV